MGANTKIEWCDHSANFWWGCTRYGEGCRSCYAETLSKRYGFDIWGPKAPRRYIAGCEALLRKLDKKAKAAGRVDTVFVNDMSDLFEDHSGPVIDSKGRVLWRDPKDPERPIQHQSDAPHTDEWMRSGGFLPLCISDLRADAFRLFDQLRNLTFLLLTKRPENIRGMWPAVNVQSQEQADERNERGELYRRNCWLGTSVATQADADRNIPELLKCRDLAPVLFVSAEPLIEAVSLRQEWLYGEHEDVGGVSLRNQAFIDWVIVGGESGNGARPCGVEWLRSIVQQCRKVEVACFVKQLGSRPTALSEPSSKARANGWGVKERPLCLKDKKGGDPAEWPEDMRVRQIPRVEQAA